ncbi:MAG: PKD domain-containing protein [Thermoplasmata archaeon]|nr:PKD domain-containing protein [Thermoplasmata archaeon]
MVSLARGPLLGAHAWPTAVWGMRLSVAVLAIGLLLTGTVPSVVGAGSPGRASIPRAGPTAIPSALPSKASAPSFHASGLTVTGNFMPWVCQFCTWSGSASAFQSEYQPYHTNMTQLSYEMYTLSTSCGNWFCSRGYEGTSNDPTAVVKAWGMTPLPMVTTCTIATLQSFLGAPSGWTTFISQALTYAQTYGYGGYNIDWEPDTSCAPGTTTPADGYHLAHFVDQFSNQSHAKGLIVTLDFAYWDSNFWNLPALAATTGDIFFDMNYQCPPGFQSTLSSDVANFPLAHLGEGMDPESGCTDAQMVQEFSQVAAAGVTNTAWWALDDSAASLDNAHLWTAVHDFVYNGAGNGSTSQTYAPGSWGLNTNEVPTTSGGDLELFTLGTDEQGYEDSAVNAGASIMSVDITQEVSFNPSHYHIFEGNYSTSNSTIVSSWVLPATNATLTLGPPTKGPADEVFFELASDPSGSVGAYQSGYPGTYAFFQVQFNGGASLSATASATPTSGVVPLAVTLAGAASGGQAPYTWFWNFGDGTTHGSGRNASHTYATVGTFTPTLTVNDSAGGSFTTSAPSIVVSPALAVQASSNVSSGHVSLAVTFRASPSGGVGSYGPFTWSFGDGASGSGNPASHTYTVVGHYNASVTVTDSSGATATSTPVPIAVWPLGNGGGSLAVTLSAVPSTVSVGAPVAFTGSPSGGSGSYVSYAWTFGDGGSTTTTGPTTTHPYAVTGTYTPTVKVTDSSGQSATSASVVVSVVTPTGGVLDGWVRNASSGLLLGGATVAVKAASDGHPVASVLTPTNGSFRFPLGSGSYVVNVSDPGYRSSEQTCTLAGGTLLSLNFSLSPRARSSTSAPTTPPNSGFLSWLTGNPLLLGLLALGIAAVAILAVVAVHRRRHRPPPNVTAFGPEYVPGPGPAGPDWADAPPLQPGPP